MKNISQCRGPIGESTAVDLICSQAGIFMAVRERVAGSTPPFFN